MHKTQFVSVINCKTHKFNTPFFKVQGEALPITHYMISNDMKSSKYSSTP